MTTFAIYAARALAVYLAVGYLLLLAVLVRLAWSALRRITTRQQEQPEAAPSPAVLDAQALAELDAELDRRIAQIDLHKREEGRQ
ncbi:hypothetical protein ACFYM2_21340 [Streptomyces sp. NPDC006711]|uniref:hypothetical protein n=1 Tax=Streptomyces sp. NPDC006711 TaxID=3364762 RepID=UPI0036991FEB